MKFNVTIDRDEDGVWIVECPAISGCVSQGKTKGEAFDNIKEAIALCLEARAEKGLPLTIETQQVEVEVLPPTEQLPTLSDPFRHRSRRDRREVFRTVRKRTAR